MADRVFLHLGVPKSGTTYLQTSMWEHRDALRAAGVLLPGGHHAHHRWAGYFLRDEVPQSPAHGRRLASAWDRIRTDLDAWGGTAVVSHEFWGAATAEQAARTVAALAPAEVHLVVTARDALGLLTAAWQETLKYRHTTPLEAFDLGVSDDPKDVWDWRNLDASEVLSRWAATVPAERVHVVVVPRVRSDEPVLWQRFAGLFLDDPGGLDVSTSARNESMGVVESELLRRVCAQTSETVGLRARMRLFRDYLAEERLVPRGGERFHPSPVRVEECRERSRMMVDRITAAGYHVVGDVEDLLVPDELPVRRTPADVTDAELTDAATRLVAEVLEDLDRAREELVVSQRARRRLRRRLDRRAREAAPSPPGRLRRLVDSVRRK